MATYINMFQRIARTAGLPSATSDFNNSSDNTALIKELINESNMVNAAITPARPKSYDLSLVAGTATYTLPADYSKIQLVNYYQGVRFVEIYPTTNDKFLTLQSVVSNATLFIYYTIKKVSDPTTGDVTNTISIYPTPGATGQLVTIQYLSISTALNIDPSATTDSTKNLLAVAPFEQVDKYYALANIFAQREQPTQAKYYEEKYAEWFEKYRVYINDKIDSVVVRQ